MPEFPQECAAGNKTEKGKFAVPLFRQICFSLSRTWRIPLGRTTVCALPSVGSVSHLQLSFICHFPFLLVSHKMNHLGTLQTYRNPKLSVLQGNNRRGISFFSEWKLEVCVTLTLKMLTVGGNKRCLWKSTPHPLPCFPFLQESQFWFLLNAKRLI